MMPSHFARPLTINWTVTALEVSPDGYIASPRCQKCQQELEVLQPREDDPQELLGTCGGCGSWHLIQVAPDGSEAWMFNIPGIDFVRASLAEARTTTASPKKRSTGRSARGRGGSAASGVD